MKMVTTIFWITIQLIIISSSLGSNKATAQAPKADSLKKQIEIATSDTTKATLLNQLSDYYAESDSGKAATYAKQALVLSKHNLLYSAKAQFNLAGAYFYHDAQKAKRNYLQVVKMLKADSSKPALILTARAWRNYGSLLQRQGDHDGFMNILTKQVIPLVQKVRDTLREANALGDIGLIFENNHNYKKAIAYFKEAVRLLESRPKAEEQLSYIYTRLSINYLYNKQPSEAWPYIEKTKKMLHKGGNSFDQAQYHLTRGMYFASSNHAEAAFSELDSALFLSKALKSPYLSNTISFQKFKILDQAKKYEEAKKTLLVSFNDSTTTSFRENRLLFLYHLAETELKLGHPREAYGRLMEYTLLADSINNDKLDSKINALELNYQTEKKERSILELQNENNEQLLTLQKRRNLNMLLISGIAVFMLISLIIFLLYRNNKKNGRQASKFHQQQLRQMEQEQQMKLYDAMLEGQEQERKRLAQDLHDGLGGMLSGVKLKLSGITKKEGRQREEPELKQAIHQLDSSVTELRRIARNLMPEALSRFGVETALQDLCNSMQNRQINIEFQSFHLARDLNQNIQITIYRIAQELLTNAIRHGQATNIFLQCSQNEDTIYLTVEDNGKGFDPDQIKEKRGIGLSNIRNRINLLKGSVEIQSTPGTGTTINVEFNIHE